MAQVMLPPLKFARSPYSYCWRQTISNVHRWGGAHIKYHENRKITAYNADVRHWVRGEQMEVASFRIQQGISHRRSKLVRLDVPESWTRY